MTYQTWLYGALVFHIIGLAMLAGSTLLDFIITSRFWRKYAVNKGEALIMREVAQVFPVVARSGIALMVLSGIAMMAVTHNVFGSQLWMRIKIGLVVLVILNILLIGRRTGKRLYMLLQEERNGLNRSDALNSVKNTMQWFHYSQLLLFVIIFTLSVFKFS